MAHILIADPSHTVCRVLGAVLEQADHEVQVAANGRQALQILLASPVSLTVLLDEQVPQIDGWHLLRLMTADGTIAPGDRYIFMTYTPDSLPPALCSLLHDFLIPVLVKPFTIPQMLTLLEQERETERLDPRFVGSGKPQI